MFRHMSFDVLLWWPVVWWGDWLLPSQQLHSTSFRRNLAS